METQIAVIGAGGWGTAVAVVLAKKGHQVRLWGRRPEYCSRLNQTRENTEYLPGVLLPANILVTAELAQAVDGVQFVVLATPAQAVRATVQQLKPLLPAKAIIVSLSKGLERGTFLRCSEVIAQVLGDPARVAVLSGPNHAEEVARDIPSASVAASANIAVAEQVQDIFMTPKFRIYTNPDVIGVELGGALKNIIALAAGVCDGLGYGDNTKAALMTRGVAEIARLGVRIGAGPLTFAGLAGIGDLIATCTSKHSRNWRTGYALGQGETLDDILAKSGMVVEGVTTTEVASQLARKLDVAMPITEALRQVIFEGKSPHIAVSDLMLRGKTREVEEVALAGNQLLK